MKLLVIANLYPSKKDPSYGTFIRNFVDGVKYREELEKIDLCVIKGRSHNFLEKIYKYIYFFLKTLYYLLFRNYDIVYNHMTHGAIPIRLVSLVKPLNLVFNLHGGDLLPRNKTNRILLKIAMPLFCKAKMIVVPSCFFKNKVKELIPQIPDAAIYVSASGGVASSFYHYIDKKSINEKFVVGFVSRVDKGKGWKDFIIALKKLHSQGIGINGIIAGNGFQIPQMLEFLDTQGANEYIDYVGPLAYEELPSLYSQMDLFIFPTLLQESLGLVGIEAMACGVPIIASKIGGITDYVQDGYNGYFFTPGDSDGITKSVNNFLKLSNEEKSIMRRNAYTTSLRYDANLIMDNLYKKILAIVN